MDNNLKMNISSKKNIALYMTLLMLGVVMAQSPKSKQGKGTKPTLHPTCYDTTKNNKGKSKKIDKTALSKATKDLNPTKCNHSIGASGDLPPGSTVTGGKGGMRAPTDAPSSSPVLSSPLFPKKGPPGLAISATPGIKGYVPPGSITVTGGKGGKRAPTDAPSSSPVPKKGLPGLGISATPGIKGDYSTGGYKPKVATGKLSTPTLGPTAKGKLGLKYNNLLRG